MIKGVSSNRRDGLVEPEWGPIVEETDQNVCDVGPSEKDANAIEDAEKDTFEAVGQPTEEVVKNSDGEETVKSEDEFEIAMAKHVR